MVDVAPENDYYVSIDGAQYTSDMEKLLHVPISVKEFSIPDGVNEISQYAFRGCNKLEAVTIPSSLTGISKYAFLDCESLENISTPEELDYKFIEK